MCHQVCLVSVPGLHVAKCRGVCERSVNRNGNWLSAASTKKPFHVIDRLVSPRLTITSNTEARRGDPPSEPGFATIGCQLRQRYGSLSVISHLAICFGWRRQWLRTYLPRFPRWDPAIGRPAAKIRHNQIGGQIAPAHLCRVPLSS